MDTLGILLLIGAIVYFIPSIIASQKEGCAGPILINIFLGWSLIGWVVALVWAFQLKSNESSSAQEMVDGKKNIRDFLQSQKHKNCPHCGEEVLATANICKHCKSNIENTVSQALPSYAVFHEIDLLDDQNDLFVLSCNPNPEIRKAVARSTNTILSTLEKLSHDENEDVRGVAANAIEALNLRNKRLVTSVRRNSFIVIPVVALVIIVVVFFFLYGNVAPTPQSSNSYSEQVLKGDYKSNPFLSKLNLCTKDIEQCKARHPEVVQNCNTIPHWCNNAADRQLKEMSNGEDEYENERTVIAYDIRAHGGGVNVEAAHGTGTYAECNVNGVSGKCMPSSNCNGRSLAGYCEGDDNIQCCLSK